MLKNTLINRIATKKIALALADLNSRVVFVGGAVVSLYIDDPSADDVRPTKDIDISLEISGFGELEELRQELNKKGFYQSSEDTVICRFRYDDIKVDILTTKPIAWAPSNIWFAPGFKHLQLVEMEEIQIQLLPFEYFLASKFSAFNNRGGKDPRTSHDFEDIVYLLNYTSNVKEIISNSEKNVKDFLIKSFEHIIANETMQEAIIGNLFYENQMFRYNKIMTLLKEICHSGA